MKNKNLRRNQLDQFFKSLKEINLKRPKLGWIKEIRESLGMSMEDLANRSGTIKQRIARLEKDEMADKVTIESLRKAATAMDCEFVYFVYPKTGLAEIMKEQALKAAQKMAIDINKTMTLEQQQLSSSAQKQLVNDIADELIKNNDRSIWKIK